MRAYARPLSINCLARNLKEFRTEVEVLYSISTWRHFKTSHTMHFLLHSFCFSVSQQQQQPPMNMSSTIKKKVTLRNINCRCKYIKEDRRDGETPSRKTKKEKSSTNSIKTRFDNFTLLENWVVCVCVNAILLWHKKMSWCFKRARLLSNTYK